MSKVIDDMFWVMDRPKRNVLTTVPHFLLDQEIEAIKAEASHRLRPAPLGNGKFDPDLKVVSNCYLEFTPYQWLYEKMEMAIKIVNRNYDYDVSKIQKFELMQYDTCGHMATHIDSPFDSTVKLSCLIPLSEKGVDYTGGDFVLYDGNRPITEANGRHVIDMTPGTLVIYPAYFLHEVTPVLSGRRTMLGTWIYGDRPFR